MQDTIEKNESLEKLFAFWNQLKENEKEMLEEAIQIEKYNKGMLVQDTSLTCKGLLAVLTGQMRIYILSNEGREVTLLRVKKGEVCVLSASCLMDSITFDVFIEATEDTELLVIPATVFHRVMEQNPYAELYLYKTTTEIFSEVMWTMQQILFLKIDQRVAQFLWDEMVHQNSMTLTITHDEIARYIGSAREVVTKVMRYFSQENVVESKRGTVIITDKAKLRRLL